MKKISKVDTRLQRTSFGKLPLAMGLIFSLIGTFFALGGFGVTPLPGKANAPLWVIGLVGVAFALAGLTLTGNSLRGLMHQRRASKNRLLHAHEPWMIDFPWDPAGIGDSGAERWVTAFIGAALLGTFLAPFNWWAWISRDGGVFVQIITGFFDVIFGLVLVMTFYRLLQRVKFGASRLRFAHFPFAPGERLLLTLEPNRSRRLKATLRFIEERFEESGTQRNRSITHNCYEHFSASQEIKAPQGHENLVIEFDLPDNPDWITQLTADPEIRYWELLLEGAEPGINFRTTFVLPVYERPGPPRVAAQGPTTVPGRRSIPYRFEIGVPLVLLVAIGFLWWSRPAPVLNGIEAAGRMWNDFRAGRMLQPVEGINGSPMDLDLDERGRVWALSKYGLVRFAGDAREQLLNGSRYADTFKHKFNALSAMVVAGADEAWVGSWHGEVFHYLDGNWTEILGRDQPLGARIHALALHRETLYLAGTEGLWSLDPADTTPTRIGAIPQIQVTALANGTGDELCAGVGPEVWCMADEGWRRLWKGGDTISSLHPADDDTWLIGTSNGYFVLDGDGSATEHSLEGMKIKAFAVDDGRLWVATWKNGLALRDNDISWRFLGQDGLGDVVIGDDDRIWMAAYGDGLLRAPIDRLLPMMQ